MKNLRNTTLALLALGLASPVMATPTNGDLGPTSTGSFEATLTVLPAVTPGQVKVYGLKDFTFSPVTASVTGGVAVTPISQTFCVSRSDPGQVRIEINRQASASGYGRFLENPAGDKINFIMQVTDPSGNRGAIGAGNPGAGAITVAPSPSSCTSSTPGSSDGSGAFVLLISPDTIQSQNSGQLHTGAFSGTYFVIVAPTG